MKIKTAVYSVMVTGIFIFTFIFGGVLKKYREEDVVQDYKGIISLWHIDTFEGGTGSRKQFLLNVASNFEKQNQGVLVMVIGHTVASAESEFEKGIFPDMVSFGNGLAIYNYKNLKTKLFYKEGIIGDKNICAIWAKGGYVLISKNEINGNVIDNLIVSQSAFTLPLVSFVLGGYSAKNIDIKQPKDAYADFFNGKSACLLGTQRDVVRLNNSGCSANITVLDKFSDLNQFIAVTGSDKVKNYYSQLFVDFLLSGRIQKTINKLSLFSLSEELDFDNENLTKMQLAKNSSGVSAFFSKEKLTEIRDISYNAAMGDETALKKLKNIDYLP